MHMWVLQQLLSMDSTVSAQLSQKRESPKACRSSASPSRSSAARSTFGTLCHLWSWHTGRNVAHMRTGNRAVREFCEQNCFPWHQKTYEIPGTDYDQCHWPCFSRSHHTSWSCALLGGVVYTSCNKFCSLPSNFAAFLELLHFWSCIFYAPMQKLSIQLLHGSYNRWQNISYNAVGVEYLHVDLLTFANEVMFLLRLAVSRTTQ